MAEGTTRFTLRRGDEEVTVRTRLLGRHNVANLLAAAAVGTSLDLPLDAIGRALARVSPPAHRLAPILNRQAGIVVIDDAYNSNPVGAAAALEVLASHQAERRLLVTPGMVELGEREAEENERFGEQAAAVCDLVVLVGEERSKPILAGLNAASFPDSQIHVVANASEAEALLAKTTRRGDVVLFENDLPDLYAEGGAAARAWLGGRRSQALEVGFRADDAAGSSGRRPVRRPLGGARRLDHQRSAADGGDGAAP